MRYITMCSGIECVSVAVRGLGWIPVAFSEIEAFPNAMLDFHYPNVPNVGDFTAFDWSVYRGQCDIVVAGTPCQAFSVAGQRESLSDRRGNLTLSFVEAVNDIDPSFILWENVPGVLSTRDNAFGCFLGALSGHGEPLEPGLRPEPGRASVHWRWKKDAGIHVPKWPNAGFVDGPARSVAWRIFDAQYFGLPQRRRRVYVVAGRAGARPGPFEILFEPQGVCGNTSTCREAGKGVTAASGIGDSEYGGARSVCGGPAGDECQNLVSGTLTGGVPAPDNLPREPRRVTSFHPTQDVISSDSVSHAVGCGSSGGQCSVAVAFTCKDHGADEDGTGRGTPMVPYTIQQNVVFRADKNGPGGKGWFEGVAPTQLANGKADVIAHEFARRMTPKECERLMGLPDDYTRIPFYRLKRGVSGKKLLADYLKYKARGGKKTFFECHPTPQDGPRYKVIGNGMAVPVIFWLARRVSFVFSGERGAGEQ